jgi:Zn-dependent metalloprotease
MIKSRRRFDKVMADSKRWSVRKMRPWFTIYLAVLFSLMLMAPVIAEAAEATSSVKWSDDDLQIVRHPTTGAVRFLRSKQGLDSGANKSLLGKRPKRAARIFLRRYLTMLGMPNADRQLVFNRKTKDALGMTHLRLRQFYQGVPVYGAEVIVHYQPGAKKVFALNGTFIPYLALKTQPTIDSAAAIATVREIQEQGSLWQEPILSIYSGHIDPAVWGNHLAWLVRIWDETEPSRNLYVVDAHTGEVLTTYDELNDARNRRIRDAQNTFNLPGVLVRSEGDGSTGDTDTDDAYDFLGATYDYFDQQFGRDSYDDSGATLRATVHYGLNWPNAFWDGSRMVFGDGFTVDDVTAHELSHAVTEHTAGLIYRNQSGALNESYSDIFGEIVDLDWATGNDIGDQDYLMGEDIPGIGAIRDMAHPPNFGDPDKTSDYLCTSSDNGGVHTNSGIPNKAAYLMAEGGSFNGQNNITPMGREKMGQVHYRALNEYLVASSDFVDYYLSMNRSCEDLYGAGSSECQTVDDALLAVEMNVPPDCGGNGGWLSAYPTLLDAPSDLRLMRQYRDEVLAKSSRGRLYKGLLYRNSEKALAVLKNNPELMARASGLIQVNKSAISDVLAGQEGVIYNTDEIAAFLRDYAQKSPAGVKFFANIVKVAMLKHKKKNKLFLGFRLE